jgi:nucleotide-binding universal stress UspA family protein
MYRHLLVPISLDEGLDVSPTLAAAKQLSSAGTRVTLLHVMGKVPEYASSYLPFGYQDETRAQIESALTDIGSELSEVEGVVRHGAPAKVIPEFAQEHDVDCIILSKNAAPGKELRRQEVVAHLVRSAPCAIHIVK